MNKIYTIGIIIVILILFGVGFIIYNNNTKNTIDSNMRLTEGIMAGDMVTDASGNREAFCKSYTLYYKYCDSTPSLKYKYDCSEIGCIKKNIFGTCIECDCYKCVEEFHMQDYN